MAHSTTTEPLAAVRSLEDELTMFVFLVEGEPYVGTVNDLAHALDEANQAGLEVPHRVFTFVDTAAGPLAASHQVRTDVTPWDADDYARVTVTVSLPGGPERATYRLDGRS